MSSRSVMQTTPLAIAAWAALPLLGGAAAAEAPKKPAAIPITHVIIIMQENRSFDSYFGTFPGANGIPNGTCVPLNTASPGQGCVAPFHDPHDINSGGPHSSAAAQADLDDGITTDKMDGFLTEQAASSTSCSSKAALTHGGIARAGNCNAYIPGINRHDAVGYHTAAELPNYWAYAQNFVLQDEMFESVRSYSLDAHLYLTSEWSALCSNPATLSTCVTSLKPSLPTASHTPYPWVNLFQLLDTHNVSWKYYLDEGAEPDCADGEMTCAPQIQADGVLSYWNPAPGFVWVANQGTAYLTAHNPPINQFLTDISNGTLPQVSWIVPSNNISEHPTARVTTGMEYVTSLVNAVMQSPYWQNTAIFLAWDDWGGFYDHVVPPIVDRNKSTTPIQGYGLRVPGLLISAYAKPGYIDHSVLSFDAYATLIENLFMNGARLDPTAMGQPDKRPDVRDALTSVTFPDGTTSPIGQLINEFDFTQTPLPPLVLSTHIPVGITIACGSTDSANPQTCVSTNVKVTWSAVTGAEVPGPFTYNVLRDGATKPVCTTTATKCTDKAPAGTHYYTVYSVSGSGVASPASAASEADVP
jgi:phospholipase C